MSTSSPKIPLEINPNKSNNNTRNQQEISKLLNDYSQSQLKSSNILPPIKIPQHLSLNIHTTLNHSMNLSNPNKTQITSVNEIQLDQEQNETNNILRTESLREQQNNIQSATNTDTHKLNTNNQDQALTTNNEINTQNTSKYNQPNQQNINNQTDSSPILILQQPQIPISVQSQLQEQQIQIFQQQTTTSIQQSTQHQSQQNPTSFQQSSQHRRQQLSQIQQQINPTSNEKQINQQPIQTQLQKNSQQQKTTTSIASSTSSQEYNTKQIIDNITRQLIKDIPNNISKNQKNIETQTDTTIKPYTTLTNSKLNPWNLIKDKNITDVKRNLDSSKPSTNTQTIMSFYNNKEKILNLFKNEYERKKRYENHIAILTAHKEANTTPKNLNNKQFPSPLIETDIKLTQEFEKIIKECQEKIMETTIIRLKQLIKDIEIELLKIKKELSIYDLFNDEYFTELTKSTDEELLPIFKKSWNKVDKIIKNNNPFNTSQNSSVDSTSSTKTKTTKPTTLETQQNKTVNPTNQKTTDNNTIQHQYNMNNQNNKHNNDYHRNINTKTNDHKTNYKNNNNYHQQYNYNKSNSNNHFLYQSNYGKPRLKNQQY